MGTDSALSALLGMRSTLHDGGTESSAAPPRIRATPKAHRSVPAKRPSKLECPPQKPSPPATHRTRHPLKVLLAASLLAFASCATTHTHSTEYNGVAGLRGEPVEYQSTTKYALHFLFIFGIFGDAGQSSTVAAFTKEASGRGAKRIHITQSESSTYWYIFPPLSFLIQPVSHTLYGEVEGTVGN
jgi:hypothetical protein